MMTYCVAEISSTNAEKRVMISLFDLRRYAQSWLAMALVMARPAAGFSSPNLMKSSRLMTRHSQSVWATTEAERRSLSMRAISPTLMLPRSALRVVTV